MTPEPVTVFLVERSAATRDLVADYLERTPKIRVIGAASDAASAAVEITESEPDVVVVDRFPGPDVLGAGPRVIMHVTTVPERTALELQRAGVRAIVFKEVGMLDNLVEVVIQAAASGDL